MHVSRHGEGARADLAALASQVHPVFMLPPLAASAFGAVLAGEFRLGVAAVHLTAMFAAVYTAHVKDGYVDFHLRGEDDDHPMTEPGCRRAILASTLAFFACTAVLWWLVGPGAAALALPAWLIAYHHAPQLDTNPVTTTTGYPLGIAISLLGGYYVQVGALAVRPLAFAVVLLVLLAGVKVIDDAQDYDYDRSIDKRTVAVVLGKPAARRFAFGLMATAMAGVVAFAAASVFPPSAVAAVGAFGVVAAFAARADSTIATMLLVRGCYVFLAVLVAAVWFRPLA
ncbi:UbiA family prenyltransferase [Halobacterium litoreum]|uniref:UbiA family prenyltransferase n=1 Tax=Halobacterium litoreum TaxID=2039234 RepID=A0ABD5NH54_9EURY|nr:UbiA family prenyltransferase [Halobacterium litoreum]UHH12538.1 UbiA family prenyltransferase [Halobacterium litoreum]